jgi:hypothetical protein
VVSDAGYARPGAQGVSVGWMTQETISVRKIAEELNQRGILASRGGEWQPTTVVRLLARLRVQAG